ncbi:MAG: hypothetical protein NUW22_06245 [Acidobacteria bacterium]|nr:hypothetical protein [Acidobacteriota bacterium]
MISLVPPIEGSSVPGCACGDRCQNIRYAHRCEDDQRRLWHIDTRLVRARGLTKEAFRLLGERDLRELAVTLDSLLNVLERGDPS